MKELYKFVPENSIHSLKEILDRENISIKIVNQRQTKHGDFRKLANGHFQITINNNLNTQQFLLTLIHEIAHYVTFQKFGRVKPHGKEWKLAFQHLMLPFLSPTIFSNNVLPYLANYLKNPKASTDSDVNLSLALRNHTPESGKSFIFEIPLNSQFVFKNKLYKRGQKRRTRFECIELESKRTYLFNQNAEVILYEE